MRADMKDVIVTPGRYGKNETSRRIESSKDLEKMDALPRKEGMKKRWKPDFWGWSFGDHVNPLRRWLRSKLGRNWDDVYSEFCQEQDRRSIRDWHLHEHLWFEVSTWEEICRHRGIYGLFGSPRGFYIDQDNILRFKDHKRFHGKRKQDPDNFSCNGYDFTRINNCWFVVWFEEIENSRIDYNGELYYYIERIEKRKQLSKKELRNYGLSNKPNFKWWENGRNSKVIK